MTPEDVSKMIGDEIAKAVTASTYTFSPPSRSIYSPENLDPIVAIIAPTSAPIRTALPRSTGMGEATSFNMITSRLDPAAGGTGIKVGFADAGQPNQTTQTTVFTAYKYKNLGRDVEIGRQQIAANRGKNIEDIRAKQEMVKTYEVILGEENLLVNGDATAETTEFSGFAKILTTNSGTAALLTTSGVSLYAQTLYQNGSEMTSHLIANPRQMRGLSDELQGQGSVQRIVMDDQGRAIGGAHVAKIVDANTGNLITLITSRYAGAWGFLLSVMSPAGQNYIEVEDLEALSIYDVPTSNHSVQSRVYETTALKVIGEAFQYKIGGLATS